jgi:7-cyano-7-deazaguanine synthase
VKKEAVVIHSGGMDSSICLAAAIKKYGADSVLSMSFQYGQRHSIELEQAQKICSDWNVDNIVIPIQCLNKITDNALINKDCVIEHAKDSSPNTLVMGRNGLMARLGAIHAYTLGANKIYMGVIEVESANSGYRDCSRQYMDLMEEILRIDLDDSSFEIVTPVAFMTKEETLEFANAMGVLSYLLEHTVTCYEGISHWGCRKCPACCLRNEGVRAFLDKHKDFPLPETYASL